MQSAFLVAFRSGIPMGSSDWRRSLERSGVAWVLSACSVVSNRKRRFRFDICLPAYVVRTLCWDISRGDTILSHFWRCFRWLLSSAFCGFGPKVIWILQAAVAASRITHSPVAVSYTFDHHITGTPRRLHPSIPPTLTLDGPFAAIHEQLSIGESATSQELFSIYTHTAQPIWSSIG